MNKIYDNEKNYNLIKRLPRKYMENMIFIFGFIIDFQDKFIELKKILKYLI